jgi:hypothetical protein
VASDHYSKGTAAARCCAEEGGGHVDHCTGEGDGASDQCCTSTATTIHLTAAIAQLAVNVVGAPPVPPSLPGAPPVLPTLLRGRWGQRPMQHKRCRRHSPAHHRHCRARRLYRRHCGDCSDKGRAGPNDGLRWPRLHGKHTD